MNGERNDDERVKLDLDPKVALRALLKVKPDDEPAPDDDAESDFEDDPSRPS